jgi:NCS1 family nucleobase:cation symporter-1
MAKAIKAELESSSLYNEDLAPVTTRSWSTYNYAALWVSMSVNILTYMLAASFIQGGMNWKQAVVTVFLGNTIVLAPMLLNSHPGAKYGVPFPVLARASFGVMGANVAAMLRALVACGWFGIQTWIGGEAIDVLLRTLWPAWANIAHHTGICFLTFWLINLAVVVAGFGCIKFLQEISAPILLIVGVALLGWAFLKAGGFGPMLSTPAKFASTSDLLRFLIPALNGTVGFWATVSLNIPDFTRFAIDKRGQAIGQAIALPLTMTLYSFVGIAVTSATMVIYGTAIWDPVQLLARFQSPIAVIISLIAILLATLNVNIGANVVSPANDFSNLWPKKIRFKTGAVITCIVGVAMMPWRLLADHRTFIFGWLGGYAAVLGPVAGIMICDYYVVRRRKLVVNDLYLRGGAYEYSSGYNWKSIGALVVGSGCALIGLAVPPLRVLYDYSWFVGFVVAFATYWALMRGSEADGRVATRNMLTGSSVD